MSFIVLIPARHASTRLPGKPLADIAGKPMVVRVAERAMRSGAARVVVATDDARVRAAVAAHGIDVCMTRDDHLTGTDRLAEAAVQLGLRDDQIVVNVQGDEPLLDPVLMRRMADLLAARPDAAIATACHPLDDPAEAFNPNVVKVVLDRGGFALYFSRAAIPHARDPRGGWPPLYKHIGVYAYRRAALATYVATPVSELEELEGLEQLRFLVAGVPIDVVEVATPSFTLRELNNPEDVSPIEDSLAMAGLE